jgi:hypothetical protein
MDTSLPPGALPEPKARLSSVVTATVLLKAFSESDIEIGTSALGQKAEVTYPERDVGSALKSGHRRLDRSCPKSAENSHRGLFNHLGGEAQNRRGDFYAKQTSRSG